MNTVTWLDSLNELPSPVWNRLAAEGGFYLSHQWLALQENDEDSKRRYVVAKSGDTLVGGLSVDLVERESNDFYRLSSVLPDGCAEPETPLMLLGGHGGYRSGVVLAPELHQEQRRQTVRRLLGEVVAASREHQRLALFCYLPERLRELVCGAEGATAPLLARHEAALELPGDRWSDYLAGLASSRRVKIRSEERRFGDAGYQVSVGDLTPWLDDAGALLANMQRRYGHQADAADMTEHLTELVGELGEHVAFLCVDDQGLVGFMLGFPFEGTLALRVGGFAYDRLRDAREYFNLAYYLPIRWAYDNGVRVVHLGIGSLEAKSLRGARLSPLWIAPVGWSWPDSDAILAANSGRAAQRLDW